MQNKRKIIFLICVFTFCICATFVLGRIVFQKAQEDIYDEMQEENEIVEDKIEEQGQEQEEVPAVEIPIDFSGLKNQNEDIYAWIRIPGTVIDYPILQHPEDDTYYLNRTAERKKGLPGSIYTENLNKTDFSDRNTLIYGHNMKNGSMFGDLSLYMDSNYMLPTPRL